MINDIITNPLVISGGVGFILTVLGLILTRKKLTCMGYDVSQWLNRKIGSKATQWVEDKLLDFVNGMRSDNDSAR